MKSKKNVALLLAVLTVCVCTAFSSCALPFAAFGDSGDTAGITPETDKPDAAQYIDAAREWVCVLSDYVTREYRAGDNVSDINVLYLGCRYCFYNSSELDDLIISGPGDFPTAISISGSAMERLCRKLIASDFSLSDYHTSLSSYVDKYYDADDLYVFNRNNDYWAGNSFNTIDGERKATVLENGNISVLACVCVNDYGGVNENFRMLEYVLEPINDGKNVYFKLLQVTDKGNAAESSKTVTAEMNSYRRLSDGEFVNAAEDDPVLASAKLEVPVPWLEGGNEILATAGSRYVRCLSFQLVEVDKDYILDHGIHRQLSPKVDPGTDEYGTVWNYLEGYEEYKGHSSSGYDYIGYYLDEADADGNISRSEQRYYRISDEYVLSVYYGGYEDVSVTVQTALDNMTVEVK